MELSGSATDDLDGGMECGVARRGLQRGRGAARRRRHTEKLARQAVTHRPATSGCHVPQPLPIPTPVQMQVHPACPTARPPVMAGVSPSSGPPVSHTSTGQSVHATFLKIHWFGNGKKCTTANTVRTKQSLVRLAINETRIEPLTFADEETDYAFRSHDRPNT
ncbi:hypothetical protein CDV36_015398 [Fusarium kuroshium]|uniref:Uncharacterized protein n=2 Tax=Fusarium solani species complex TaxID=232080 RepID=A0A3M2RB28_9HYPO|nr:hypothetical protein CDV36_015398 [Fusarium kuroshium]RSL51267.1 hypothetical protein CEP51_015231 [Fusarium floridanum]